MFTYLVLTIVCRRKLRFILKPKPQALVTRTAVFLSQFQHLNVASSKLYLS